MKIDTYTKLQRENFPGIPEAFEGVFDHLNRWFEQVVSALQRKLTFEDNFNSVVKEFEVLDNKPVKVQVRGLKGKPTGLLLLDRQTSDYQLQALTIIDQETVSVQLYFPTTAPLGGVKVRLLVIGS